MKKKGIIFLSIIILILSIILSSKIWGKKETEVIADASINNSNIENADNKDVAEETNSIQDSVKHIKVSATTLDINTQVELNKSNCQYSLHKNKVNIEQYVGNEDLIIIPNQIDGNEIEKISADAFEDCYNLEIIKISKDIAENCEKINDFEVSGVQQDENYIEYITTREYSDAYISYLKLSEEEKSTQSIVPEKFSVSSEKLYSSQMQTLYEVSDGAVQESYDLRDKINIEVENQNPLGICYAYSALSAIETNIALTRNEVVDLSEIHLSVMTQQGHGGVFVPADYWYYSSKIGPVYEIDWPAKTCKYYDIISKYCISDNPNVTEEELKKVQDEMKKTQAVEYVTGTVNIPAIEQSMKQDETKKSEIQEIRNTIKKHILKYGGLYASISMNDYVSYNGNMVMNYGGEWNYGHSATIIGWDDNFSKDNFPTYCKPENDGAYLALNSWGEEWGDDGYFWISYEDRWVETALKGVTSVESITDNIKAEPMKIINSDTNQEIRNNEIIIGDNIRINIDVNINSVTEDKLQVKIRNAEKEFNDLVTITGKEIVNNKSNLEINLDTKKFEKGAYIIEIIYGEEIVSKQIKILPNVFDYKVNDDGESITILGYNGKEADIEIPKEFLGYKVTAIGDKAFNNTSYTISSIKIYENIINVGESIINNGTIIYGYENTKIEEYAKNNNYLFIKIGTEIIEGDYWKFNIEKSILYITGEMPSISATKDVPWYSFNKNIKKVVVEAKTTQISNYAFRNCVNLESVELKEGLNIIGEQAFEGCEKIEKIELPEEVTQIKWGAFRNCTNIKEINLPEGLNKIIVNAFHGCSSLEKIEIPEGVTEIKEAVFKDCTSLKEIKLSKNTTKIESSAFAGCVNLIKIDLPEGLTVISNDAFNDCSSLKEINLPKSLTTIGYRAFNSAGIEKIELPEGITQIEYNTFSNCSNLKEIVLPDTIAKIGWSVFLNCTKLEQIVLPKEITQIDSSTFAGCTSLTKVEFPEKLEKVGGAAFSGCKSLEEIILPEDVKTIAIDAFKGCIKLKKLYLPQNIETIHETAFSGAILNVNVPCLDRKDKTIEIPGILKRLYDENDTLYTSEKLTISNCEIDLEKGIINLKYEEIYKKSASINIEGGKLQGLVIKINGEFPKVDRFEITKQPDKTVYTEGEDFKSQGIVIECVFADGYRERINGWGPDADQKNLKLGQKEVTFHVGVRGESFLVKFPITVIPKGGIKLSEIKMTNQPTKTSYKEGENFDKTGLIIMGYYNDGSSKEIKTYTVVDGDKLKEGQELVTITYAEGDITKTLTIPIKVNKIINDKDEEDDKIEDDKTDNNEEDDKVEDDKIVDDEEDDKVEDDKIEEKEENTQNENNNTQEDENNLENEKDTATGVEKEPNKVVEQLSSLILKSGNNYLKALTTNIEGTNLNFDKNIREYKLEVGSDIDKIKITAQKEDKKAKVEIIKNEKLMPGSNYISVVVEAENGLKRAYTIEVIRGENQIVEYDNTELQNLIQQVSDERIIKEESNKNIYIIALVTMILIGSGMGVILIKKRKR